MREVGEATIGSSQSGYPQDAAATDQTYEPRRFAALIVVGVITLALWLAVVVSLAPARLLTYVAFFVPLWASVTAFSSAAIYRIIGADGVPRPHLLRASVRRGALFAALVVANLGLVAGNRWTVPLFLVTLGVCLLVEMAVWSRQRFWADGVQ